MKKISLLILLVLSVLSFGCSSGNNSQKGNETGKIDSITAPVQPKIVHHFAKLERGKILYKIKCLNDSNNTFSLYLPAKYDTSKSWPLILFFDAHARGKLPLKKYQALAEKYQVILMGSNDSKNGLQSENYDRIINNLLGTGLSSFNIDEKKIIAAGFSGGAKVAASAAMKNEKISSVIGCAAPFDPGHLQSSYFNYAGITGKGDFNFWDMVDLDAAITKTPLKHKLLFFDGIHEWPDAQTMSEAIAFVMNLGTAVESKQNNIPEDRIRALEQEEKNEYIKAFQAQDASYWMAQIDKLQSGFKDSKRDDLRWMNRRLLSFINMMTYLRATELLNGNHLNEAETFIKVFRASDPKNPDGPYLTADLYALRGNKLSAISSLNEALKLGYDDFDHFKSDPMLQSIKNEAGYYKVNRELMK
jgi:predicted esterase